MSARIEIVVADDHPVTRAGTINILQRDERLSVVGEAIDGMQAIDICRTLHPHLLLLDVRLPKTEGLMVANLISKTKYAPRIIMFSAFADTNLVKASLDAGAHGYILKSVAGADLLHAIHNVMCGQQVLLGVDKLNTSDHMSLSARELITLSHVAEGLSTKEIAWEMSSSTRTIETYLNRIFLKLGASNRTQAVAIARREQLLPIDH